MKKALFIISIVSLTAVFGFGQSQKKAESDHSTRDDAPQRASNSPVKTKNDTARSISTGQNGSMGAAGNAAANVAGTTLTAGTLLSGELQNSLDVRRSKVGDRVVIKTVRALKQNGQTVVPKGTQLIGRVTEITQRSKGNGESRIGMIFDRLEGSTLSQPISASIVSITNAAASLSAGDDMLSSDIMGSSSSSAGVSRGSGSGGLLGGTTGVLGGATGTLTGVTNAATRTVGGVTDTTTGAIGKTTQGLGGGTLNGLRITGSASGSANSSTTVSSGDRDLHIDKGATFNLRVNN